MEILISIVIYALIAGIGYARRNRTAKCGEPSLCLTCANAVITRGTRGQEWIACNYAGAMRPVKFTVCECSAFAVRGELGKLVTIEGFAREKHEVYAEIAIS